MSGPVSATVVLADLASGQWGMVTTAQARREGVSPQAMARLADAGHLERVRHGVYRVAGAPPGPSDPLRAAWLAIEPGLGHGERLAGEVVEVVSHRSAAQLYRLGDVDADRVEFTSPERRQPRDRAVRFHHGSVPPQEWTLVEGLPVTTALRTITDLARGRLDGGHLAGVVRDAVTTLHLDPEQVARALRPFAHHYGAPVGDGWAVLSDLLQLAGVPKATRVAAALSGGVLVGAVVRAQVTPVTEPTVVEADQRTGPLPAVAQTTRKGGSSASVSASTGTST